MSRYFRIPPTEHELIEMLEKLFPVKQWKSGTSGEDLAFNAGQRSVVEFLKDLKQKGEQNILN